MHSKERRDAAQTLDVVIVGAGFAGLYMLHRVRGLGLSARVFEAAADVGGTWYWNPGARCDVESLEYSYSFMPEFERDWRWTERFATQPEILGYINHVADRLALRGGITFTTRVQAGRWDEAAKGWIVTTDTGEIVRARYLIMATGCLSVSMKPDIAGITVSGVKSITPASGRPNRSASQASASASSAQVHPACSSSLRLQRRSRISSSSSEPCISACPRNALLSDDKIRHWQNHFPDLRRFAREETRGGWLADLPVKSALEVTPEEREAEYRTRWAKGGGNFLYAYTDIGTDQRANDTAAEFVRARFRETVKDPKVAELLTPRGYPIGAKRICVGTDFYETFNRSNVTLVDVASAPIERLTERGIRTTAADTPLDMVIFATGFDAMVGAVLNVDLTGVSGTRLKDKWHAGPVNYLGMTTSGFPNFFMITGPGSPSVLSNVVMSIEQHVEWVSDLIGHMGEINAVRIEPTEQGEREWVAHCNEVASRTLMSKADSWYVGANFPGKPRVFMPYIGGVNAYRRRCDDVARAGYAGFSMELLAHARTGDLSFVVENDIRLK